LTKKSSYLLDSVAHFGRTSPRKSTGRVGFSSTGKDEGETPAVFVSWNDGMSKGPTEVPTRLRQESGIEEVILALWRHESCFVVLCSPLCSRNASEDSTNILGCRSGVAILVHVVTETSCTNGSISKA
jgi:hypothetical protein